VLDLSGINDIQPFLDAAKEAGLFVIARPGPYIKCVSCLLVHSFDQLMPLQLGDFRRGHSRLGDYDPGQPVMEPV
jgi:hypothetical protein